MATIAITQDLKSGASDLVSVHNFNKLKWTFVPTTDSLVITSTVTIGAYVFNGILTNRNTATNPDTFSYELDVTEILKYFINDFYYKLVADDINLSTLVNSQAMTFTGYEDGVSTDTDSLTLYLSHGVHQIGNATGSNMKELYDADDMSFHYFKDYPFEVYFFVNVAITALINIDGVFERIETIAAKGLDTLKFAVMTAFSTKGNHTIEITSATQLVTGWTNDATAPMDTFVSSGRNLTSIITDSADLGMCYSNDIVLVAGDVLYFKGTLTKYGGSVPYVRLISGEHIITIAQGVGEHLQTITIVDSGTYQIQVRNDTSPGAPPFVALQFAYVIDYMYKYSPFQILTVNTLVTDNCGGLYVRYLSREGFYRYWLFNKYYSIEQEQSKIGSLINYFDIMIGAQGRSKSIGYKNAFKRYIATSENVEKSDRKILMDIFTSPAVYLWLGDPGDASVEADWILCEVDGSHTIKEKKNFDNFTCSITLPEIYTQRL